jgi:DNA-binding XRE family transcriptional regulator
MNPRKIRAMLVERGITNADIARDMGVTRNAIYGVIAGRWSSRAVATEIARRINLPLEKVFPKYKDAA